MQALGSQKMLWFEILSKGPNISVSPLPRDPGVRPIDGHTFEVVKVGECDLENVDCFSYLGDMLSAGVGCMAAATARCRSAGQRHVY